VIFIAAASHVEFSNAGRWCQICTESDRLLTHATVPLDNRDHTQTDVRKRRMHTMWIKRSWPRKTHSLGAKEDITFGLKMHIL